MLPLRTTTTGLSLKLNNIRLFQIERALPTIMPSDINCNKNYCFLVVVCLLYEVSCFWSRERSHQCNPLLYFKLLNICILLSISHFSTFHCSFTPPGPMTPRSWCCATSSSERSTWASYSLMDCFFGLERGATLLADSVLFFLGGASSPTFYSNCLRLSRGATTF